MSRSIPASACVDHFDPELAQHRAWAVLEQLLSQEPRALEEGGSLRRLWTEHQQSAPAAGTQTRLTDPPQPPPRPVELADGSPRGL